MRKFDLLAASALAVILATPAVAQEAAPAAEESAEQGIGDIVVTAQRQAERLQDVPIAVSAFSGEALDKQQIKNANDLQLSLPNITFTKTNFTSSSFTIRGIGDLCVGVTCDSATGIHVNDMPLTTTRLFETEYFDLERIEVLRGPQGTLFGRNATSGVVNFVTAKPDLTGFQASGEGEYGNFDSIKFRGMVNVPIGETLGIRVAGLYQKRDGYTLNVANGDRIDDRDLYAVRGSLRWEPSSDTTLDLMAYYFREKDNRSRIQKQLCHRDPTGVLGCLPDKLDNDKLNGNATLASILTSSEFLRIAVSPAFAPFALGSLYGPDVFANAQRLTNARQVAIDYTPTYFAEEEQYQARLEHDFGPVSATVTGGYTRNVVNSRSDYNLAIEQSLINNPGLLTLQAAGSVPGPFQAFRNAVIPNGPAGGVCQSDADRNGVGVFGGNTVGCFASSLDFDQSNQTARQYSIETHVNSQFDGPLNFLLGGIYVDNKITDNNYYVNAFGLDYAAGLLGAAATALQRATGNAAFPNTFRASPFFRSNTPFFTLESYGIFGEAYYEVTDKLKLTAGLRYNHDDKFVRARTTLLSDTTGAAVLVPFGSTSITQALGYANLDFDAFTPGPQEFSEARVKFGRLTGRAVVDYKITDDNLLYLSYSRGYKSGGINPPLSPIFAVPRSFGPETVNAFELGSKNTFANGRLRLNLTGFYYQYKALQLSRIVARTSVNDNVDADIYGVEAEAVVAPDPRLLINLSASYLHTEVSSDKFLFNPRDPSAGRSDAVIIKDITNASNCAVVSTTGNAVAVNTYVAALNGALLLRAPTPVPGTNTTGAFSICSVLAATAANPSAPLRALFGVPTGPLPFTVEPGGVPVNIKGNQLPQAPTYKFAAGVQYTAEFDNGMSLVPRFDLNYTGDSFGNIFNGSVNKIKGYTVLNAQIQLNGVDDRWFVRGFIQNITNNNATTGLYVTDQSSGLFTNIFTLEPRRYGIAAGFKF